MSFTAVPLVKSCVATLASGATMPASMAVHWPWRSRWVLVPSLPVRSEPLRKSSTTVMVTPWPLWPLAQASPTSLLIQAGVAAAAVSAVSMVASLSWARAAVVPRAPHRTMANGLGCFMVSSS